MKNKEKIDNIVRQVINLYFAVLLVTVAQLGFPLGETPTLGWGRGPRCYLSNFLNNCTKARKFWSLWGGAPPLPDAPIS